MFLQAKELPKSASNTISLSEMVYKNAIFLGKCQLQTKTKTSKLWAGSYISINISVASNTFKKQIMLAWMVSLWFPVPASIPPAQQQWNAITFWFHRNDLLTDHAVLREIPLWLVLHCWQHIDQVFATHCFPCKSTQRRDVVVIGVATWFNCFN